MLLKKSETTINGLKTFSTFTIVRKIFKKNIYLQSKSEPSDNNLLEASSDLIQAFSLLSYFSVKVPATNCSLTATD